MFTHTNKKAFTALFAFILCGYFQLFGQDEVAQLKERLKVSTDTVKLRALLDLSRQYLQIQPDEQQAKFYTTWAVAFSDSIDAGKLKAYALFYEGERVARTNTRAGISILKKALAVALEARDLKGTPDILNNIGNKYITINVYDSALYFLHENLKYTSVGVNKNKHVRALANLANGYLQVDSLDQSWAYFNEAEKLAKAIRFAGILGFIESRKGSVAFRRADYKAALQHFEEALDLYKRGNAPLSSTSGVLASIASTYGKLGDVQHELEYLLQAAEINKKLGVRNDYTNDFLLATAYVKLFNHDQALSIADSLLIMGERDSVAKPISYGYYIKAAVSRNLGQYVPAIDNYLKALKHADDKLTFEIYGYMSSFYLDHKEDSLGKYYALAADKLAQQLNTPYYLCQSDGNLAAYFLERKKYDSALYYSDRQQATAEKIQLLNSAIAANITKGTVYFERGQWTEAFSYLQTAYDAANKSGSNLQMSKASQYLAKIHLQLQQPDKAIDYATISYQICRNAFNLDGVKTACETLSGAYAAKRNYKDAFRYYQEFVAAKDSLFDISKAIDIGRIESVNKLEQTRFENELLKKDGELKLATIQVQQNQLYGTIAGALLLLTLAILLYRLTRVTQKTNAKLAVQNKVITDQNEELAAAMEKLRTTQDQLIQSEKMASLGMLTAGIAHEINNPINFVSGGVQALEATLEDYMTVEIGSRPQLETDIRDLMASINNGVGRVAKIVAGLDVYSRHEAGKSDDINLTALAEFTLTVLPAERFHGIEIVRRLTQVPRIFGNEGQISNVIYNLLTNAADAIRAAGRPGLIVIENFIDGNHVVLAVRDNGAGISAENKPRIFDPFFTTKPPGEGVGLGLSISREIITDHKGNLSFETSASGTTFFVRLSIHGSLQEN